MRPAATVAPEWAVTRRREGTTTLELDQPSPESVDACVRGGVLPVLAATDDAPVAGFVVDPAGALALRRRGVAGWRITVVADGGDEAVLDAVVRSRAAHLRVGRSEVAHYAGLIDLPGVAATISVFVDSVADAGAAIAAGAGDLLLRDWDSASIGELRDGLDGELVERTAFPLGVAVDDLRDELPSEVFGVALDQMDGSGVARPRYSWAPGRDEPPPIPARRISAEWSDPAWVDAAAATELDGAEPELRGILERSLAGSPPDRDEVVRLFRARGAEVELIASVADRIRRDAVGDTVTYVVNRNINYTNQCYFRCGFCAFSKGPRSLDLRGEPYLLEVHEVAARTREAWDAGATEVCLQGGIHPEFTGDFYVRVVEAVKEAAPGIHIHGFTPLEVWQGAETLGVGVGDLLRRLRDAGLGTLPGTAAEVLDDAVRAHLCPDKITTAEWSHVMVLAHEMGLRSTATMMFGHIDGPESWANHFEVVRRIQSMTGGFTEFVPLPFVHMGAPIYLRGRARPGPTWDEVVLVHAVARIAFAGLIDNVQASWVKLGLGGASALLGAGCNDLGGTLIDENISRAAGASHGQSATAAEMEDVIVASGRVPLQRTTLYRVAETT
jgi:FO synthase